MVSDIEVASYADPCWIEAVLRDCRNEVDDDAAWPIILVNESTRRLIWYLCGQLEINPGRGIAASACRLMERYLARYLRDFLYGHPDQADWIRRKEYLASKCYLLVATCLQLAAKMADTAISLNVSTLHAKLLQEGFVHSKEEIIATEYHVYKILDYRIPLWTSLDTSQFLAASVGITDKKLMKVVAITIDCAEYYRFVVQYHMQDFNGISNAGMIPTRNMLRSTVNTLHLCAGSVCAATRFMRVTDDYVLILSKLTCAKPSYITAITDIIFNFIIKDIGPYYTVLRN